MLFEDQYDFFAWVRISSNFGTNFEKRLKQKKYKYEKWNFTGTCFDC